MAMPFDYSRNSYRTARPFGEVTPIIDATTPFGAIRQVFDFMVRHQGYVVGVPDTSFFPFSAICHLRLTFPSGIYNGTGFYIGPNLILSAGHNLFDTTPDGSSTEAATSVHVRVGRQNATTWLDEFTVTPETWVVHKTFVDSGATNRGFDLSVIRVPHAPPGGSYFHMINYSPSSDTPIAVCGHGGEDVDSDRQHLDIDKVRSISADLECVQYNLQTRKGNSGSPVFAHFDNTTSTEAESIPVMAVHVSGGGSQLNNGCLLTPDKADWALSGGLLYPAVAVTHSLSATRGHLGGLPLVARSRSQLGGLPLGRGTQPVARPRALSFGVVARPFNRAWIVIDTGASGGMSTARRTFGHPSHDLSGKTTLSVRVPNMPAGGSVRWNIPDTIDQTRVVFETGSNSTSHSATGTSVTLQSIGAGPCAVDCMVKDASGTTVESNKYWLSSPQFIFVAIDPSTDAFFDGIGLGSRRGAIYAEMQATMRHIYRRVNIRFVFPGDTLPLHLGLASDPAFPGGVRTLPGVYYSETIGSDLIMDPEETRDTGVVTPYGAAVLGRNHEPGNLDPPLNLHSIARSLIHRFAGSFTEVNDVEAQASAGTLAAGDLDLAARMYGRIMGENAAHEVGHFTNNAFVPHDGTGGLMDEGDNRSFTARTGMTPQATGAIMTDAGRGAVNDLSATLLRNFEEFLPIDPPIDLARLRVRGRLGSFALGRNGAASRGWVNGSGRLARAQSTEEVTVHLPGATVLSGWQAQAFVLAIETAFRTALGGNPAMALLGQFTSVDAILGVCDRCNMTLALGLSYGWALGAGGGAGHGIVFAPGHRIGFYGALNGIIGSIYSMSISAQLTLIRGGPEVFSGAGYMVGVSVGTLGWVSAGTADLSIAAHAVFNAARQPIGLSFEFGIGTGLPVVSLIEAYAQQTQTVTTFGRRQAVNARRGRSFAVDTGSDAYRSALQQAMASGATPSEAEGFLNALFA